MGLVYSDITLSNPVELKLSPIKVKCLADMGSTFLVIPTHIMIQLDLKSLETREVITADGKSQSVPYVGPVKISFENRSCYTGAIVLGNEVLLGAVPMEDMDLIVVPKLFQIKVNPESPNIARGVLK